jgi:hypothetical protein
MSWRRGTTASGAALLLAAALVLAGPANLNAANAATTTVPAAAQTAARAAVSAKKTKKAQKTTKPFVVTSGITFNHPFRKGRQAAIQNKIVSTLRHVKKGQTVRVMTWNFDSPRLAGALIAAHKRGVSVQIIMSRPLAMSQGPGRSYPTLRNALAKGNQKRPATLRSWIHTCFKTCRGNGGAMHDKLMLVSQSGKTKDIVMEGSANFTGAAAYNQFNDWVTITNKPGVYKGWMKMWNQARKDKPVAALRFRKGDILSMFSPHHKQPDPAMHVLNEIKCHGATNRADGRTKIRIANAVWGDQRGVRIAQKVKQLSNQGCNIKIVMMMMPLKIRNILKGLRAKQMVYIVGATANKFKDRYVHLKGMSVQGNIAGKTDGAVVLSSSENWTQLCMHSDEQDLIIYNHPAWAAKYANWVDLVYKQAPRSLSNYVGSADPQARMLMNPKSEFLSPKDYPFAQLEDELS